MRYRKHDWFNAKTRTAEYGIQCKPSPQDCWFHCHENGTPLIYKTEAERDAKLADLKAAAK